ncbi:MAG TPA: DHHA1 domain-containing protein [Trueperaceae bacterium]|nr:DHHA1 domain-containing protein [Trueperaceae bacterium]
MLIKEFIDALGVTWSSDMATACLAGLLSDTGNFRFGNTNREVLTVAGELIDVGVDYVALTDRLQWRDTSYFGLLAKVMATVKFAFDGRLIYAELTDAMRDGDADDDSDDFVGVIRYAEGANVAVLLKERGATVKVSVRTRDGVSAQRICLALGGGGHVAAAGATITGTMAEAEVKMLAAVEAELNRTSGARS